MTQAQGHRSQKLKGHYERQFLITERNKMRRHNTRLAKRDSWRLRGIKKNGRPVAGAIGKD